MSVEENNNENEAPVQVDTPEVAPVVEPAPAAAQQASEANAANVLASVLALREANPKVFYGGAAGVLLLLIFLFSGGSDAKLPVHQAKPVVIGQNYQLKSANAYDPNATIRLVSVDQWLLTMIPKKMIVRVANIFLTVLQLKSFSLKMLMARKMSSLKLK